jgi:DNA replication protein DnaC
VYDINTLSPMKRNWLLRTSNIPTRFLGLEPADIVETTGYFPDELTDWIDTVVNGQVIKNIGHIGTTGVGLLFDGLPGLGKTTHAVVAAMEVIRRLPDNIPSIAKTFHISQGDCGTAFRPVQYMTYPEFLSLKKSSFEKDVQDKGFLLDRLDGLHGRSSADWLNVRILILDDLGKEYGSKYDDASFDEILRLRYDKALPTIVTTNVKLENWEANYSEAMASFAQEAFVHVPLIGKDLRADSER